MSCFNSVTITTVAASLGVLGQENSVGTGGWCWINSELDTGSQVAWMVGSGKGWELLCYLCTGMLYFMCKLTVVFQVRHYIRQTYVKHFITSDRRQTLHFVRYFILTVNSRTFVAIIKLVPTRLQITIKHIIIHLKDKSNDNLRNH